MDQYEAVRNLPLAAVLAFLGVAEEWKTRKNGKEQYGRCPIHAPKKNSGSFSFDEAGKFNCFSCHAKGRGSIDLAMQVRQVNFRDAVEILNHIRIPNENGVAQRAEAVDCEMNRRENAPFEGSYEKFAVDSPWLAARGFTAETLKRYEVFQYDNPKRRSAYSGSVMLKIRRYSDNACVGYLSRNIGEVTPEKPKYCFPKGFQKSLEVFGASLLKEAGVSNMSVDSRSTPLSSQLARHHQPWSLPSRSILATSSAGSPSTW